MRESIHKYFQVGTIRWMSFPNRSVVDQVKRIAVDDYFDAIEVTKCADDAEREEVKKILEQSHLKVCYGAQPRLLGPKLNPNDIDEEGRKKAEETLLEAIDEAQYIKNQTTHAAKSVRLINSSFRMALTGTPMENRLSELWSIFDYLMPGFLYGYTRFRSEIETPIVSDKDEDAMTRLRAMIHPFILRRLKKDV